MPRSALIDLPLLLKPIHLHKNSLESRLQNNNNNNNNAKQNIKRQNNAKREQTKYFAKCTFI